MNKMPRDREAHYSRSRHHSHGDHHQSRREDDRHSHLGHSRSDRRVEERRGEHASSKGRHRNKDYVKEEHHYKHDKNKSERDKRKHSQSSYYLESDRRQEYDHHSSGPSSSWSWEKTERASGSHHRDTAKYSSRRSDDSLDRKKKSSWSYYGYTDNDLKGIEQAQKDDTADDKKVSTSEQSSSFGRDFKHGKGNQDEVNQRKSDEERKSRGDTEKDQDQDSTSEGMFDWDAHRYELNKLFFSDDGVFKRGSDYHTDFLSFFERYQAFQAKKLMKRAQGKTVEEDVTKKKDDAAEEFELPKQYKKHHKEMVRRVPSEDMLKSYGHVTVSGEKEDELTVERILEFRKTILLYLDFKMKQEISKLVKLRKDQASLPIAKYRDMIVEAVHKNRVVIVAGDTGCGKSTQVPQYLLAAGFSSIAVTQPRRIACISLSKRVSFETLNEYGSEVGYQIRFETTKTESTKLLFLTEGLLLRQLQADPMLSQYSVIILDEVHERHLYGDFLLGVLRCLLEQRDDLKLVLMSATINISLFSSYFEAAPVIQVPGRLFPIQVEYVPLEESEKSSRSERLDPRPYLRIMQRIDHKYPATERGDLLVFLSGISEITSVVEAARLYATQTKRWIVLPLHSSLSVAEQDKAFDIAPEGVRKCIVSTNIAETSVTIDGVRFIVDSGKMKEMNFNSQAKMRQLQEFWISRASAEQRKGRAGRTGPGNCFRLYSESDYDEFQAYSTPEIQRVPLDSLILQMVSLGLKNPRKFPFIESPPPSSVENSIAFLKEQGALTAKEALTPVGRMLSQLPVDVVIGKMLIMGTIFRMIDPVLTIAAALSVQSPFTSRAHRDHDAMSARKSLESDHGDPFTLLNAYDEWIQIKASRSTSSRKWCNRRGLEEQRFYEMSKLKKQFKDLLDNNNLLSMKSGKREYSTLERQTRNKERRRMRELKHKTQNATKRRKLLKLEQDEMEVSDDDEESDDDMAKLADMQFKLAHDMTEIEAISNMNRSLVGREINLLKVILCSGLYPQLAIADDCNSYRRESDQVFHTKPKPFVVLHPTGIFASHPDVLEPPEGDTLPGASSGKRGVLSAKHQLLSYVFLLETNKPYLMNTMRVPALQTMLLYAGSIDTNHSCTRLVVDEWLEFCFADQEAAEEILPVVLQLRAAWIKVLELRLKESQMSGNLSAPNLMTAHKERLLAQKLAEYLASHVDYTMRKLQATDLQHLYVGSYASDNGAERTGDNFFHSFSANSEPHPTKGGWMVTDFMTYGCLIDADVSEVETSYTTVLRKHWTCPTCERGLVVTLVERLQHEAECSAGIDEKESVKALELAPASTEKKGMEALRRQYDCPTCYQTFSFTTSEIMKHKRAHAKEKPANPD